MNEEKKPDAEEGTDEQMAGAREVAGQAAEHAREFAGDAAKAIRKLEPFRLYYLIGLVIVVLFTLIFDMASFDFKNEEGVPGVFEQIAENAANASSVTVLQSGWEGTLMWLACLAGIGIVIWSSVTKSMAPWVPLAEAGCAGFAVLMLFLLLVGSFGGDAVSATLFGVWIPFLAAVAATFFSVSRILKS